MVSSKFSSKALEQKTPPHCRPCKPFDIIVPPTTMFASALDWSGDLPSPPFSFNYHFDLVELQPINPRAWYRFKSSSEPPFLQLDWIWQPAPGRWTCTAQITPAPGHLRHAEASIFQAPLHPIQDSASLNLDCEFPTDSAACSFQSAN